SSKRMRLGTPWTRDRTAAGSVACKILLPFLSNEMQVTCQGSGTACATITRVSPYASPDSQGSCEQYVKPCWSSLPKTVLGAKNGTPLGIILPRVNRALSTFSFPRGLTDIVG